MRRPTTLLLALLALGLAASPAQAIRVGPLTAPVVDNPVDRLSELAPDPEQYDPATHCRPTPQPGMDALVAWLGRTGAGESWGTYRCERWGKGQASLHAEGRAVDWHLDSRVPAQREAGKRLIRLLLAPDSAGTHHALARRMGVQELIWDCSYWGAGSAEFGPYSPCFAKSGARRKRIDPTVGHLDHLHIGLSKAGAAKRTSWWRQGAGDR